MTRSAKCKTIETLIDYIQILNTFLNKTFGSFEGELVIESPLWVLWHKKYFYSEFWNCRTMNQQRYANEPKYSPRKALDAARFPNY